MSNQALVEFFSDAGVAVGLLADKVSHLAGLFRAQDLKQANEGLSGLSSELKDFVVMIGVMQGPLSIDPGRLTVGGMTPDEQIARIGASLEAIVAAQRDSNWVAIADILARDLEPVLRGWKSVLQECAEAR